MEYTITTDGWSWYVTRDGHKITSLGVFGSRDAAQAEADRRNRKSCPGWGEDCGTLIQVNDDLCGDCRMGRMNEQSPR